MNEEEIKQYVRESIDESMKNVVGQLVPEVVTKTMEHFGFDIANVNATQQDMAHLRKIRKGSEVIKACMVKTCISAALLCFVYLVFERSFEKWAKLKAVLFPHL